MVLWGHYGHSGNNILFLTGHIEDKCNQNAFVCISFWETYGYFGTDTVTNSVKLMTNIQILGTYIFIFN